MSNAVRALTKGEAEARAALVEVQAYEVELDLTGADAADDGAAAPTFGSRSQVRFACRTPGSSTFVEVWAHEVRSATLNGRSLDLTTLHDGRLPLPELADENVLVVEGRFAYSRTGEGLHRYRDPEDGLFYLYSQTFLNDAQRVFACFDQPDLKAPFTFTVTAPQGWTVLTNTPGRETSSGQWQFERSAPLATYFAAVAAGPYEGVHDEHGGITLGLYSRRSMRPHLDPDRLFRTTKQGLDYFQRLLGIDYAFGKYDQVMVPEFNAGAMENPGLVTFRDEHYLRRGTTTQADREQMAGVQLHEMAHMWFGDLVTMRWWDDLWLNESFAEYLAHRALVDATEHTDAWATFSVRRKAWGYHADQLSTTHPVATDADDTAEALGNFDGISYAKGASALRQLAAWLGDDVFVAGLRAHLQAHRFGNATLDDVVGALSAASGRDVATWATRWLRTAGVSSLAVETAARDGEYTGARVVQTVPDRHPTPRPHTMRVGLYDLVHDKLQHRTSLDVDVEPAHSTAVPALLGLPEADLVLPNDGDLTFALTTLDEQSLTTVLSHLAGIDDLLTRALLWNTLWQMVGAGRLTPAAYLAMVRSGVRADDGPAVTSLVLARAITAATLWSGDVAAQRSDELAAWCLDRSEQAEAGSDVQLELARAWCRVSSDTGRLRSWAKGRDLPPGLTADTDLRWRVLQRLATLGAVDADRLDEEYQRDRTSAAWLHRLGAGAALASPDAKESSWTSVIGGRLSNHELEAVARGFWQPGQEQLLVPYRDRYVEALPQIARTASAATLDDVGRLLFPRTLVEPATVDAAEKLLSTADLPAPARRIVAECRDDVLEGLRASAVVSAAG
ncbi:MAG TPA: aminopeptidase N [Actinomycetales bacterium]|nr:aminopeptidase N [Actinomycetales bacterium]